MSAIMLHVIEAVAERVFIPLTVGGGVRQVGDVRRLLNAGADKVSINTAAVQNPGSCARRAISSAASASWWRSMRREMASSWQVYTHGGRRPGSTRSTGRAAWRRRARARSCSPAWTATARDGFDWSSRAVADAVGVPVIASGGVGAIELAEGVLEGHADAVLAASVFHFGDFTVRAAKEHMRARGIEVRL